MSDQPAQREDLNLLAGEQNRGSTQPVSFCPSAVLLQPYAEDVNQTTYSPVGALAAAGSCENTPASSCSNENGPVAFGDEVMMTRLFRVHAPLHHAQVERRYDWHWAGGG